MSEFAQLLTQFSTKWIAKYPTSASRISKGQALALAGHVSPWDAHSWRVISSDKERTYWVEVTNGYPACDCPDFAKRNGIRCCHIWACALMTKVAEELTAEPPEPPTRPHAQFLSLPYPMCRSASNPKPHVITEKSRAASP